MLDFICVVVEKIKDVFNTLLQELYAFETDRENLSTRTASSDYIYNHEMSNFM